MDKIVITRRMIGICYMQVCAKKGTRSAEILKVCNRDNPSGTIGGWMTVIGRSGPKLQRPVTCADHADRQHFIVAC